MMMMMMVLEMIDCSHKGKIFQQKGKIIYIKLKATSDLNAIVFAVYNEK